MAGLPQLLLDLLCLVARAGSGKLALLTAFGWWVGLVFISSPNRAQRAVANIKSMPGFINMTGVYGLHEYVYISVRCF